MKKISLFLSLCLIVLSFGAIAQLKVTSTGKVGIGGANPTVNQLEVNGQVRFNSSGSAGFIFSNYSTSPTLEPITNNTGMIGYGNNWQSAKINSIWTSVAVTVSDEKLKENIKPIPGALDLITKLRGVKYDLKPAYFESIDATGKKLRNDTENLLKNRMGFIAQEMAQVMPELVVYDSIRKINGIVYENLIPVLVEAMKEQQAQIETLKAELENCCKANLKSASLPTGTTNNLAENVASLDQNIPNPFSQETRIGCTIPEDSNASFLYIYNMNGTQLKQYFITGVGKQSVTINGNSFEPGMYLYALVIDGREVDTKRMILTK
jgi:hypothetical protein